jgi:hypothetical protein
LGQGGIKINDIPRRFGLLADGDELTIGRYQVRVMYNAEPTLSNRQVAIRNNSPVPLSSKVTAQLSKQEPEVRPQLPVVPPPPTAGAELPASVRSFRPIASFDLSGVSTSDESILVPIVNQFGQMQQQMFDQFQQAMAMMVQMFGTMHRDQMAVIREELDRLNDLTDEFHALRAELAGRTQQDHVGEVNSNFTAAASATQKERIDSSGHGPARAESAHVVNGIPGGLPTFTPGPEVSRNEKGGMADIRTPERLSDAMANKDVTRTTPDSAKVAPERSSSGGKENAASIDQERDSVVWLHQRIMMLQQERETRWQKILKLLPGVS